MLMITVSISCGSLHLDNRSKYQKKNMKRFTNKHRYFNRAFGTHVRKKIEVQWSGTYRHPAVTNSTRKRLKSESWLKKIGDGEIDFLR